MGGGGGGPCLTDLSVEGLPAHTWGCEPVCCGRQCVVPSCPSELWPGGTRIHVGLEKGCCNEITVAGSPIQGVMCCVTTKDGEGGGVEGASPNPMQEAVLEAAKDSELLGLRRGRSGRQLSPINFTSYGWVYTWE